MPLHHINYAAIPFPLQSNIILIKTFNRERIVFQYYIDGAVGAFLVGGTLSHQTDILFSDRVFVLQNNIPLVIETPTECNYEWYFCNRAIGRLSIVEEIAMNRNTDNKPRPVTIQDQPIGTDPLGGLKKLLGR